MIAPLRPPAGACDAGASEAGASVAGASDAGAALGAAGPPLQAAATMTTPMSRVASCRCRFIACVLLLSLW